MWYSVLCDRQRRNETCKNCVSTKKKTKEHSASAHNGLHTFHKYHPSEFAFPYGRIFIAEV
jgi:hypothetical protein